VSAYSQEPSPVEILIVEDSPTQAQRLKHILEQQGFPVHLATNGRNAIEQALRRKPSLIISDVVMPEMDGYEMCRRVKSEPALADVPVILVTTMSNPEDVIRGLECRADNFILKPYEERYLISRVHFVLVNREVRQSDQPGMGLEIFFDGAKHFITADRLQILNLLLSTYDAAIQRNKELHATQDKLKESNADLQRMALDLENRVAERTHELERTNETLRQTQKAVMQQERLSALGQMASGIAHDINNAISPIALYTQTILESEAGLTPRARDYLRTIECAIDDVAATVARMREFYRQREPEAVLSPVNLNPLVEQVSKITQARWSDMPQQRGCVIRLELDLAPNLPVVLGLESEIREALVNLIFNSVDAMPDGGVLTLCTKSLPTTSVPGGGPAFSRCAIEVSDTGLGMDENTKRRCLEPFFTTKGERGTGLGLAMVYGIAQRHNAEIEIDSVPGRGTTMRLSFRVPEAVANVPAKAASVGTVPPLKILIVDDDPLLLKSLNDTLGLDQHRITTAKGGEEGIAAFLQEWRGDAPFDVVITDLGMPKVDGRKVAAAVKEASPATPVILLTGWGQRLLAEGETPAHVDHLLSKPPKLRELREALFRCATRPPRK
jgi:signal transduction histidine kinase